MQRRDGPLVRDLPQERRTNLNIHALLLRADPGSTLAYLSEKTKRDWVVPPIRFLRPDKYLKYQNAERKYSPGAQVTSEGPLRCAQHPLGEKK